MFGYLSVIKDNHAFILTKVDICQQMSTSVHDILEIYTCRRYSTKERTKQKLHTEKHN